MSANDLAWLRRRKAFESVREEDGAYLVTLRRSSGKAVVVLGATEEIALKRAREELEASR